MNVMLLLLIGIYGISAMTHSLEFQYINKDSFSHIDTCEMCFGYDCVDINESRCQYYREVDNIMNSDEDEYKRRDDEISDEVDDILWNYVDKAAVTTSYKDCIPFVSQYTNCYKGNICTGCEVCNCDIKGEWNCSTVEQCYAVVSLNVDHRTLALSIESLKEYRNLLLGRYKRSIYFEKENKKMNPKNILNWFFRVDKFDTSAELNNDIIKNVYRNNNIYFRQMKKRDTIPATNSKINSSTVFNKTEQIQKLFKNVLNPLINIVNAKRKELNQLSSVQENLVILLKPYINISVLNNVTNNTSAENPSFYFLQFELPVELDDDLRKQNSNINNYLIKLKNDINEVFKDITVIQRNSNTSNIPQSLKILAKAIKYYMRKENKIKDKLTVNLKRHFDMNENHNKVYPIDVLTKILEVLDKNMATYDPLESLSGNTKEILKRIIKQFHADDYINTSIRNFDYDIIANNLNNIGVNWKNMTSKIDTNPSSERLYTMKLLHLQISKDIIRIIKAMELINLLKHRRMSVINNIIGEDLVSKLEINFDKLKDRVKEIIHLQMPRYQNMYHTINKPLLMKDQSEVVKKSFLQRLKKILKNSKKGIKKLLHKAPILKENKQKSTENKNEDSKKRPSEYEETMQRLQNSINIVSRKKRNAGFFHNFVNRFKNILPSFLGGNKIKHTNKKINNSITTKKKHRPGHSKTKKIASTTSRIKLANQPTLKT